MSIRGRQKSDAIERTLARVKTGFRRKRVMYAGVGSANRRFELSIKDTHYNYIYVVSNEEVGSQRPL